MDSLVLNMDGDTLQRKIEKFIDTVEDVPWGNSDWQNQHAIVNRELTPERAYRHASLRIMNRLQALNESYYSIKKHGIEIKKLERRMEEESDPLEKELIDLEINKAQSLIPYTKKLIKDAIREVESLLPIINTMGKLSREQFEKAEGAHFKKVYENFVVGKSEGHLGLETMGYDLKTGEMNETLFNKIMHEPVKAIRD